MQVRNRSNVMIINPTEMTEDEEVILSYALENQAAMGKYYHNTDCLLVIPINQIECETDIDLCGFNHIQLTHHLLRRLRNSDTSQYRYEVYGKMIGGGSFGKVYMSVGTLVPLEKSRLMLKKSNARVIKEIISINNPLYMDIARQEYEMTHRDEELGAKYPVFFKEVLSSHEMRSIIVMKYISGEELRKVIQRDQINKKSQNYIDTDTRIKMSISMAIALEKVHRNNIIHADIKSANAVIDMLSPLKVVKIIDYGGSSDMHTHLRLDTVYTPLYAAPEIHDGHTPRQESDVYSSSWIFNEIWRGDDHPAQYLEDKLNEKIQDTKNPITFKKLAKKKREIHKKVESVSHHCKFTNLFIGIHDLDKSHRHRIEHLLKKESDKKPANRGYFQEAVEVFEDISFDRIIQKLPHVAKSDLLKYNEQEHYIKELKNAHLLGIHIRKQLDKFVTYSYSIISNDDLARIKHVFLDHASGIQSLSDKQDVISLFTERLRVMAFLGLKSKQGILEKLTEIIDGYILNMNTLLKIKSQFEEFRIKIKDYMLLSEKKGIKFNSNEICVDVEKCQQEILMLTNQKHQLTIDKIASINIKLNKYINKLQTILILTKTRLEKGCNELTTKQNELKIREDEISKMSYLNFYYQATVNYVGQMGFFTNAQQSQADLAQKNKHEVRITQKNYQREN